MIRRTLALSLLLASSAAAQAPTSTPTSTATPTPTEEVRAFSAPVPLYVQGIRAMLRDYQSSAAGDLVREGDATIVLIGSDGTVLQEARIDLSRGPLNPSVDQILSDLPQQTVDQCRQALGLTAAQMSAKPILTAYRQCLALQQPVTAARPMAVLVLDRIRLAAERKLFPSGTMTPTPTFTPTSTATATATFTPTPSPSATSTPPAPTPSEIPTPSATVSPSATASPTP